LPLMAVHLSGMSVVRCQRQCACYKSGALQVTVADSVLEIGSSTGEASAVLAQHSRACVGLDISPSLVEQVIKQCPMLT